MVIWMCTYLSFHKLGFTKWKWNRPKRSVRGVTGIKVFNLYPNWNRARKAVNLWHVAAFFLFLSWWSGLVWKKYIHTGVHDRGQGILNPESVVLPWMTEKHRMTNWFANYLWQTCPFCSRETTTICPLIICTWLDAGKAHEVQNWTTQRIWHLKKRLVFGWHFITWCSRHRGIGTHHPPKKATWSLILHKSVKMAFQSLGLSLVPNAETVLLLKGSVCHGIWDI